MNRSLEVELQSLRDADGNASATPSSSIGQQPPPPPPPPPAAAAPPVAALPLARIPLRVRLWRLLEEPSDSILGSAIALVVVASVLLSITAFVVQSLPQYVFSDAPVWPAIELTCIVIFTAEYCTRLACCPDVRAFLVGACAVVGSCPPPPPPPPHPACLAEPPRRPPAAAPAPAHAQPR